MPRGRAESLARTGALVALGAFALHQLRYLAGYGSAAGAELAHQGHGYLAGATPVLAALALSGLLAGPLRAALRRAGPAPRGAGPLALRRRALLFGLAMLAVLCFQESLEGALSAGHPAGAAALLAGSGWTALPIAVALGAACALLDRGLEAIETAVARRARPSGAAGPGRPGPARPLRDPLVAPLASDPLAFGLSRRPPPRFA
ncbi:MAG: hypothetical protein U0R52_00200 [Solirubrobacterales bacterium]